jgi:protein-tyrosine phosphatase
MPHCSYEFMKDAEPATRIRKGLYMGSKDGVETGGFDMIVSAAEEWKAERKPGITTVYIPLRDVPFDFERYPHELLDLVDIAADIAERVRGGERVFIFCNMGMNRSGLMTALTMMHLGATPQSAIKAIRRRHPCTLSNESFVRAIQHARAERMV